MANMKWIASLALYSAARKLDSLVGWMFRRAGELEHPLHRAAETPEPAEPNGTIYDVALTDYARTLRIVPPPPKTEPPEEPLEGSVAARTRKRF